MENMGLGLMLMLVGMITVFAILLVVIFSSRLMIRIVNRIAPAEAGLAAPDTGPDAVTRQVLDAAVAQLTDGKGRITNITKL
ncbi:MAG: OadG family protein [Bacteroidales bacterium]|nr:OadG family protein [Bacteroidales bacterium]